MKTPLRSLKMALTGLLSAFAFAAQADTTNIVPVATANWSSASASAIEWTAADSSGTAVSTNNLYEINGSAVDFDTGDDSLVYSPTANTGATSTPASTTVNLQFNAASTAPDAPDGAQTAITVIVTNISNTVQTNYYVYAGSGAAGTSPAWTVVPTLEAKTDGPVAVTISIDYANGLAYYVLDGVNAGAYYLAVGNATQITSVNFAGSGTLSDTVVTKAAAQAAILSGGTTTYYATPAEAAAAYQNGDTYYTWSYDNGVYTYGESRQGIAGAYVVTVADATYDGTAKEPAVTVSGLTAGTDFTVGPYADNINAGTGTVTITGTGNYIGTTNVTFTIAQKAVTVTADAASKTYGESDPALTATVTGLVGEDTVTYTVSRAAGNDAGTYEITPTGAASQGNYAVSFVPNTFTINRAAISVPSGSDATYDGTAKTGLAEGTGYTRGGDYTAIAAGSYTATATPDANHMWIGGGTSAEDISWSIAPASMTITVAGTTPASAVYTGSEQTANVAYSLSCDNALYDSSKVSYSGAASVAGTNVGNYPFGLAASDFSYNDANINATFSVTDANFTINQKPVTVTADNKSKTVGEADPELTATVSNNDPVSYTISRASGNEPGTYAITPTGDASQGNYTVTFVPGTFTINSASFLLTINYVDDNGDPVFTAYTENVAYGAEYTVGSPAVTGYTTATTTVTGTMPAEAVTVNVVYTKNTYTITWLADDDTLIDTTTVEYGATPTHADPTKVGDDKYGYEFTGWSPDIASVTGETSYKATFSPIIVTPLALALNTNATLNAVSVSGQDASVAATLSGDISGVTVNGASFVSPLTFTGIDWNAASNWAATASQGSDTTAETSTLAGRVYAKGEASWFSTNVVDGTVSDFGNIEDGIDLTAAASAAGQMVRINTRLDIGTTAATEAPNVGTARGGFAVLQLSGDTAPAFYAYNGSTWVKLYGATPAAGEHDVLIAVDTATNEAYYYVDGVSLYQVVADAPAYAISVASGTTVSAIGFANPDGVRSVSGEYDVPYVAAIGDNGYTTAADTVSAITAALGSADAVAVTLLANGVTGDPIALAVGKSVTVDAGSYTSGLTFSAPTGYRVADSTSGTATTFTVVPDTATIIWVVDGTYTTNTVTVGNVPVYDGTPEKAADAQYTYAFDTWAPAVVAAVAGETTYTAQFTPTLRTYTISWDTDGNGVADDTTTVAYGTVPTHADGSKPADAQYTYTFTGWSPTPYAVTGAETYVAQFREELNKYTVTFTWHEDSTSADYDYGTAKADVTVPADPASYVDNGTIYTFTGWSAEVPDTITANVTITAQYSSAAAVATVITIADAGATTNTVGTYASFAEAVANATDGSTVLLLDDVTLDARVEPNLGANTSLTIDLGGNTITREGTSGNGSAFDVKSGDVTIQNGAIDCTQDDTAIAKDGVYAITSRSGSNVTLADLEITVDSECGACAYPFSGSTMTIESGTYANLTTTPYRYNPAITGMAVNQPNEATQSLIIKGGSFSKYDPQLGDDSGKMTDFTDDGFVAIDDGNGNWVVQAGYNVTFDANGGTPAPAPQRVAAGGKATEPATDPTKAATAQYTYAFDAWQSNNADYDFDTELSADLTLVAAYTTTVNQYNVTFVDEDGKTVLKAATAYDYGTAAADIEKPADPTKDSTTSQTFTFAGWSPAVAEVTGDATYTATYTPATRQYNVTFVDEDGETVLKAATAYDYGTAAADIVKPDDPTKAANETYTYRFTGWDPSVADVSADAVYTAVFESTYINYTIVWTDHNGTNKTETLHYGDTPTAPASAPAQYVENGNIYTGTWPTPSAVTGNATYAANYTSTAAIATVLTITDNGATTNTVGTYASLKAAVDAASAGDTVVLLADDNVSLTDGSQLVIDKALTIDGDGHTVHGKSAWTAQEINNVRDNKASDPTLVHCIKVVGSGDVTIKNVALTEFADSTYCNGGCAYAILAPATYTGTLTLDNVEIDKFNRTAIDISGGTFEITNCVVNCNATNMGSSFDVFQQPVQIRSTATGRIVDTTVEDFKAVFANPDGDVWDAGGIVSWSDGAVDIVDCTVTTDNEHSFGIETDGTGTVTISGTTVEAASAVGYWGDGTAVVINSGDYTGELYGYGNGSLTVNGGTFDQPVPDEFAGTGLWPTVEREGKYTVDTKRTVTFSANDATFATVYVADGDPVAAPDPAPTKDNYTFRAWQLSGSDYVFSTPVESNITLTADWTLNQHTVIWVVEGVETTNKVDHGTAIATIQPADPTKAGDDNALYTFTSWDPAPAAVTADATYTAQFKTWTKVAVPTAASGLVYTGAEQTGVADGDGYGVTDNTGTAATSYTATASLDDTENTVWSDATEVNAAAIADKSIDWSIAKAEIAITVAGTASSATYTGAEQTADVAYAATSESALFAANKVVYSGDATVAGTTVGTYAYGLDATDFSYDDANVDATFTVTDAAFAITAATATVPTAVANLVYDGTEQTGVADGTGYTLSGDKATNAGAYTATATLAANYVWSDDTTAAKTIEWSIARKPVTVTADDASKNIGTDDPASFTATVDGTIGSDTVSYTVSREAGETAGEYVITATGDTQQGNYAVSFETGTFTINMVQYTVTWNADGGTLTGEYTSGSVDYGTALVAPTATKAEDANFTYEFLAWEPALEATVTSNMSYTATYTAKPKAATVMSIALDAPTLDATGVSGKAITVAADFGNDTLSGPVDVDLTPADGTIGSAVAGVATATFDADWNEGIEWSIAGARAPLTGKTYLKAETAWDRTSPSAEGEAVRIQASIEFDPVGPATAPTASLDDRGGITVLNGKYAAYDGSTWVALDGVNPADKDGPVDLLMVADMAAQTPTVRYYIDGVALYNVDGVTTNYAIGLKSGNAYLTDVTVSDPIAPVTINAEYDVSYVAAVETANTATGYTNLADVVLSKAGETLVLLQANTALEVELSNAETITVDYSNGSFATGYGVRAGTGFELVGVTNENVVAYSVEEAQVVTHKGATAANGVVVLATDDPDNTAHTPLTFTDITVDGNVVTLAFSAKVFLPASVEEPTVLTVLYKTDLADVEYATPALTATLSTLTENGGTATVTIPQASTADAYFFFGFADGPVAQEKP